MVVATSLLLAVPVSLRAQMAANANVPLEHWSVPYVEYLIRKQVIPDPLPLVRPFTVADLRGSLMEVDSTAASTKDLDIIERLLDEFGWDRDWVGVTIEADAGVWAATHARRNSNLRESGDGHVFPRIGANGVLQVGMAAVVMHGEYDPNLDYDPDFAGKDSPIDAYYPNAYLAFRSKYFRADFGRQRRNSGPTAVHSLVYSPVPYPYDHLFFMIGNRKVHGEFLVADIDPMIDSNGELSNRYFAAHRIAAQPWDFIDLALWGGQIIAGPGQHWEMWFLNPVPIQHQSRDEQNRGTNVTIGGDGQLRLGDFRISGSLSLDDLQFFSSPEKNDEPPSYALTGVVDWAPPGLGVYSLEYSLISNLSYRTHNPAESFLTDQNLDRDRFGVGLAHNFTDYDLLTLKAGFIVGHCLLLRPELSVLRQGEGDLRAPFPPREDYPDLPSVHTGIVETTLRAAVQGTVAHPSGVTLAFDAGVHRISDYEHVEGASKTKFVGAVHLRYVFGTAISIE
ncbi:MAG: hypothetical protein PVF33_08960 [Candidatus Latescibacterota bacterium]